MPGGLVKVANVSYGGRVWLVWYRLLACGQNVSGDPAYEQSALHAAPYWFSFATHIIGSLDLVILSLTP
eukprot:3538592-Amphidinium_carterae.1